MQVVEISMQAENRKLAIKQLGLAYKRLNFFSLFGLAASFVLGIALWPVVMQVMLHDWMVIITLIYMGGVMLILRRMHRVIETLHSTNELAEEQAETLKQRKSLERENALFRRIIDGTLDPAIFVSNVSSVDRLDYVNDAVCRHFGASREEIYSWRVHDWDAHCDEAKFAELRDALKRERTIQFETEHILRSGEQIPVQVTLNSVEFGDESYLVGYFHSLAQQKAVEEIEVRQREVAATQHEINQRMQRYFESAPGYFYTLERRPDGSYVLPFASDGIRELFGIEPDTVKRDFAAFVALSHPDDVDLTFIKIEESAREMTSYHVEYRIIHPQKGVRWMEVRALPTRIPDGGVRWDGFYHDVTERKQAEIELHRLEQEFRILAENLPDPVFRYTLDGKRSYVNKAVELISGQSIESLLAHSPDEAQLVSSADGAKLIACIRRVAETGLPSDIEVIYVAPDGVRHEYINRHVPEFGPNGEVVSVLAIGRDISAVRESERALLERKAFLDSLLNAIPIPVFYKDRQGRYLGFNPAFETFFGATQDELIGKDVYDISPRELAEIYYAKDAELFERGGVQQYESQVKSEQGVLRDVVFSKAVFCDSQGNIIGLIGTILDITERKRVAQTLEQREREFRMLVENIPDHIARYDRDCRTIYHNQQLKRSQGVPAGERLGKTPSELKPDGGFNHFEACIRQVIDSGEPSGCYVTLPDIGNGERFHQVRLVPEKNESGEVCGVLVVGRDITELKRSEMLREFSRKLLEEQNEQLRGYREKLEQKVVERTRELSTSNDQLRIEIGERKQAELKLEESRVQLRGLIAHREDIREEERKHIAREVHDELGQILSGLKLNIDILGSQYANASEPLRKHVQETLRLVGKAIDTVRNIASSLRPIELDMGIVYALNILVRRFGTYTGIQCKVHVYDSKINLDESHAISLYRITQEALTNVAKHAKADEVSISLKREADSYALKVRDNGRGFDINENKANSFGLLGIRERVNMLGGTATVNSSPGRGTEIAVYIPVSYILEES